MKAFFSYSSVDREIVQAVASDLGRPFVAIDAQTFEAGEDLLEEMDEAVSNSEMFVLFLSRACLASVWAAHEAVQARYAAATGRLRRVLVVLLDDSLGINDVPEWLRHSKYVKSH